MSKLVEKYRVKYIPKDYWNGSNLKEMYVYGPASVESNQEMQEPLEKLYQYENQPDMREKIKEYIGELDTEISRLETLLEEYMDAEACTATAIEVRLQVLTEVKNDLQSRLEEVI